MKKQVCVLENYEKDIVYFSYLYDEKNITIENFLIDFFIAIQDSVYKEISKLSINEQHRFQLYIDNSIIFNGFLWKSLSITAMIVGELCRLNMIENIFLKNIEFSEIVNFSNDNMERIIEEIIKDINIKKK